MKIKLKNGSIIEPIKSDKILRGNSSRFFNLPTKELCPNCKIEMDIVMSARYDVLKDNYSNDFMLQCGICSFGVWVYDE